MSAQLRAALAIEWLKFRHAIVALVSTALLIGGIAAISAASLYAAGSTAPYGLKAAAIVGDGGWPGLAAASTQVFAVGGFIAFGTVCGWMFGREFTDGTVVGLYG